MVYWILLICCIETYLMVFFWKTDVYSPEKSSPAHFGPLFVEISLFLAQNQYFSLYLPNGSLNFADILYRNLSYGLLWKNWGLQSGKNLVMPILDLFGPNLPLFGLKSTFSLCLLSDSLSLDDFLYRNYSYGLLLENWGLQSGKI